LKGKKTRKDTGAHHNAPSGEGNVHTQRIGFSREGIECHAAKFMVLPMPSSQLKPVLLTAIACILWDRL
jgi:hypothetical protein